MGLTLSFRFVDEDLNRRLIARLKGSEIRHTVDEEGTIHYSPDDEEVVENEFVGALRSRVFRPWQVLTCPKEWIDRYRNYMIRNDIPFREELAGGQVWFLIPRKYRPHLWKPDGQDSRRRAGSAR